MSKKIAGYERIDFCTPTPLTKEGRIRIDSDLHYYDGSEIKLISNDNIDVSSFGIEDPTAIITGNTLLDALGQLHDELVAKTTTCVLPTITPVTLFDATSDVVQTTYNHGTLPGDAAVGFFRCTLDNPNGDESPLADIKWSDPAAPAPLKTIFRPWPSITRQRILHLVLPLEPGQQSTWEATIPAGQSVKLEIIGYGKEP